MRPTRRLALFALLGALALPLAAPAPAQAASTPEEMVAAAMFTARRMLAQPDFRRMAEQLKDARGVLIVPSLLKGGFIIGASGGSGVLLSRDANGVWSYPAFYSMGAGSIGLQAGFQDAEVMFVIHTNGGLNAVLNNNVKLGVDASVAIGPIGGGLEGSTTTAGGADITAYSKTRGLFAGGAFEGAVIYEEPDWAATYYGAPASARAVVMDRQFMNADADGLRAALAVQ